MPGISLYMYANRTTRSYSCGDYNSIVPYRFNRLYMSKWRRELKKGSECDVVDFLHDWYTSRVIEFNKETNRVFITYDGWGSKWDEWISRDNARIQPYKSIAIGGGKEIISGLSEGSTPIIFKVVLSFVIHDCRPLGIKRQLSRCLVDVLVLTRKE